MSSNSNRKSFYEKDPVEPSTSKAPSKDEDERTVCRDEFFLDMQLSRQSVTNNASPSGSSTPEEQFLKHYQTCIEMFAANKINSENVWQLDSLSYLQNLLETNEKISDILEVAGATIDVGTKIYSVKIDDMHNQVLKLAQSLSKVNITETIAENCSDNDEKAILKPKTKKIKRNLTGVDENRITIVANEELLNAPIIKHEGNSHHFIEPGDVDGLLNIQLRQKPDTFELLQNTAPAKSDMFSEITPPNMETNNKIDLSTILPVLDENLVICPPFHGFAIDKEDTDDNDIAQNGEVNQVAKDELGNSVPYIDPDIGEFEPVDTTMISNVGAASNNAEGVVYITDMQPGTSGCGSNSDYSFPPAPIVSSRGFQITGVWAGPAHWKHKFLKRPIKPNAVEPQKAKRIVKHSKKLQSFENCLDKTLAEIEHFFLKENEKKMMTISINNEDVYTVPDYSGIDEDSRCNLLCRSDVKVDDYASIDQKPVTELDVTIYDEDNEDDNEYCPITPLVKWDTDDSPPQEANDCPQEDNDRPQEDNDPPQEDNNPPQQDNDLDQMDAEGSINESFHLVEQPDNIVPEVFVPYAPTAKRMDMKKLKAAIWAEIEEIKKTDKKDMKFSEMFDNLKNNAPPTLADTLTVPLAFVALLHLATEHNLIIANEENSEEVIITFTD